MRKIAWKKVQTKKRSNIFYWMKAMVLIIICQTKSTDRRKKNTVWMKWRSGIIYFSCCICSAFILLASLNDVRKISHIDGDSLCQTMQTLLCALLMHNWVLVHIHIPVKSKCALWFIYRKFSCRHRYLHQTRRPSNSVSRIDWWKWLEEPRWNLNLAKMFPFKSHWNN